MRGGATNTSTKGEKILTPENGETQIKQELCSTCKKFTYRGGSGGSEGEDPLNRTLFLENYCMTPKDIDSKSTKNAVYHHPIPTKPMTCQE
jgi:hypothetical protein